MATTAPRAGASPDDPSLRDYRLTRTKRHGLARYAGDPGKVRIAVQQQWRCRVCKGLLFNGESVDVHHRVRYADSGADARVNLEIRHEACHYNARS
jgi:RNA-directed DNA polymerase